ncbi:MAG: hypothetical protein QGF94_01190 [Candidatus Thalassarchaeaceae archaeon]|jgi:hypothetical protein|nr:hypothetical protein [Candidatus Thalassarchaeaceae archaeon]
MTPEQARISLVAGLLICAGLLAFYPVELAMSTEVIFDDEVDQRVKEEAIVAQGSSLLILRIRHDDGGQLTNDIDLVQSLMQIEQEVLDGSNPNTSWDRDDVQIARIESPFQAWDDAFSSRNRSLKDAEYFGDVLNPSIPNGWCGNASTDEERAAFESTLLMLPKEATLNVACPAFEGSSSSLAPVATEILWLVWLEDEDNMNIDWAALGEWADKVSENTEFEFSAVGMNMMFAKAKQIAVDDIKFVLLPAMLVLGAILTIGLRDPLTALFTLGGVGLVLTAELGLLSALGFQFSVIDTIAIPIIMGVAVDGAFWYSRSSRERHEVRDMLFLAMMTTIAAVSLSLFSPMRAHRSLGLVMAIGIILDWIVTRYLLEDVYLKRREKLELNIQSKPITTNKSLAWMWPIGLLLLAAVAVSAPPGVEVIEISKFLPEDDPALDEMEELQSKYVLASSASAWIVVDVDGNSTEDFEMVQDLQQQLGTHPSVISLDTGLFRTPMIIGMPHSDGEYDAPTIDLISETHTGSLLIEDARLQKSGVTTGVSIAVFIDGQDTDAALAFYDDAKQLLVDNDISGDVGGDLPVGAEHARTFESGRIAQIISAGVAIFLVSFAVLGSPIRAARIAIGCIAIGGAIDGMATLLGGRGVNTAPAVLLGMGFTADYLSHASADHPPTRLDTTARWGAALTSISVFAMVGFAKFPLARDTGQLLAISIFLSVLLATFLSFTHLSQQPTDGEE